ncbi:MAG: NADPH-dependent 7-cyano-7-deazaguanine reductase QueF [Verrucomicrobia bacterium]|nr:NADPH-dependent 7-cyano-7-deazaguanine reductase QueF [Verrucomicrobiota bacterium]
MLRARHEQKADKNTPPLTLLGNSQAAFPKSPKQGTLEAFPNPNPNRDYTIRVDCPDFTSLCPVTGQPDFAEIIVEYVPDERCIETKSLKLYLASYRNVHSFNEAVINRILDDLVAACHPRRMRIEGRFVARGGLALTVIAEHPQETGIARRSRRNGAKA